MCFDACEAGSIGNVASAQKAFYPPIVGMVGYPSPIRSTSVLLGGHAKHFSNIAELVAYGDITVGVLRPIGYVVTPCDDDSTLVMWYFETTRA